MSTPITDVPRVGAPLVRALAGAGYTTLADLDGVPRTSLITLHGVGKAGLARVEEAMGKEGLALKEGHAVVTATDRGEAKAGSGKNDLQSVYTDADVDALLHDLATEAQSMTFRTFLSSLYVEGIARVP